MKTTRIKAKIAYPTRNSATEVSTKSVFANMTAQTSYATSCPQSNKN